jgi:putative oxidoreductase
MADLPRLRGALTLVTIGRIVLGLVFLYAAYAKLHPAPGDPWSFSSIKISLMLFALQVDSYQLLPSSAVLAVARTIPFVELGLGLLLLLGWGLRYVAAASSLLLLVFFGVMVRTYHAGLQINCGCFGPGEQLGIRTLVRDGLLLALSLAITLGAFLHARIQAALASAAPDFEKVP